MVSVDNDLSKNACQSANSLDLVGLDGRLVVDDVDLDVVEFVLWLESSDLIDETNESSKRSALSVCVVRRGASLSLLMLFG